MEDTERIEHGPGGPLPEAEVSAEQIAPASRVRAQRKKSVPKVTIAEKRLAAEVLTLTKQLEAANTATLTEQKRAEAFRQQLVAVHTYYNAAFATINKHLGNVQETLSVLQFKGGEI